MSSISTKETLIQIRVFSKNPVLNNPDKVLTFHLKI